METVTVLTFTKHYSETEKHTDTLTFESMKAARGWLKIVDNSIKNGWLPYNRLEINSMVRKSYAN